MPLNCFKIPLHFFYSLFRKIPLQSYLPHCLQFLSSCDFLKPLTLLFPRSSMKIALVIFNDFHCSKSSINLQFQSFLPATLNPVNPHFSSNHFLHLPSGTPTLLDSSQLTEHFFSVSNPLLYLELLVLECPKAQSLIIYTHCIAYLILSHGVIHKLYAKALKFTIPAQNSLLNTLSRCPTENQKTPNLPLLQTHSSYSFSYFT